MEKNLLEAESIASKNLIERKDQVIQKADKDKKIVITDPTKYLEGINSVLSDSCKFMPLPIDEGKWLNCIINLENKLKDRFKVLKNEEKFQKKNLIIFAQLELSLAFYMVILKYIKQMILPS